MSHQAQNDYKRGVGSSAIFLASSRLPIFQAVLHSPGLFIDPRRTHQLSHIGQLRRRVGQLRRVTGPHRQSRRLRRDHPPRRLTAQRRPQVVLMRTRGGHKHVVVAIIPPVVSM